MKLRGIIVIVALSALVVTARVQAAGCGGCEQPTAAPAKEAPAKEAAAKDAHCPMMASGCPMSSSIDKAIALLDQAKDTADPAKARELIEQARKVLADGKAHMAKNAAAANTGKSTWGCPMHPKVQQAQAGKCPICGMALKEIKAAPAHSEHHH